MDIEEVIGGYKLMVGKVKGIRQMYPRDAALQEMAAELMENMVDSLITLTELYHYSERHGAIGAPVSNKDGGES